MQVYINREGQQYGPFSIDQVNQALAQGSLLPSDLAWHEGAPNWVPLSNFTPTPSPAPVAAHAVADQPAPTKREEKPKPHAAPKAGTKKWPLWVGIGVGVVLAIALVWWLFLRDKPQGLPKEEPIKPPTPEQIQQSAKIIKDAIRQKLNKRGGTLTARDLGNVDSLQLFDFGVYDVAALGDLKRAKELDLTGNHINDLAPLAGLTNLEDLLLDRNQVTGLSALSGLTKLHNLGLEDNRITDLTPLMQLKQLKSLQLKNNPRLTKAQIQTLQQALPGCKIDSNAEQ